METAEEWTVKYAPTEIKDIIGSNKQVELITGWLNNYDTNKNMHMNASGKKMGKKNRKRKVDTENISDNDEEVKPQKKRNNDPNIYSSMLIYGDNGCGKTCLVRAILAELNYDVKFANLAKKGKSINTFIEKTLFGESIYDIIKSTPKRKPVVVVDDIESITKTSEKKTILGLLRTNNETWACPLIFIGSTKHKKIINIVKKDTFNVAIYEPRHTDMMRLFVKISENENMMFMDETIAHKLISHSQSDYRRMTSILQELKSLYGTTPIDEDILQEYTTYSNSKDIYHTIYGDAIKLFSEYNNISDALKVFERDKTNIPLMVQENSLRALNSYATNKSTKLEVAHDIANSIAKGDIVENYICSDQGWCLRELHGFYTCVYPSYKLNTTIKTDQLKRDAKYPFGNPVFQPKYPKDLNKTSTKKINYKNVKIANKYFGNMTINDYIFGIKIIKDLLEDDRQEDCSQLLKGHNALADIIIYIMKIDKINGTKKEIPKHIIKKIKDIYADQTKQSTIKIKRKVLRNQRANVTSP